MKTVEQFHTDFIKFTEQLREVDSLKQKHEKLCTGFVDEQKRLRSVFKMIFVKYQTTSPDNLRSADRDRL